MRKPNGKNGHKNGKDNHSRAIEMHRKFDVGHQDPTVGSVLAVLRQVGLSAKQIREEGGPAPTTIYNWSNQKTRQPHHSTMRDALYAGGYEFAIVKRTHDDDRVRAPHIIDRLPDRALTSARPRFAAFKEPAKAEEA